MYIDHTCIRVVDLEASKRFYEEAFGFKVVSESNFKEEQFTLSYLSLPGEDYKLELTYNYNHAPYDIGDGYGHIAIIVDNVHKYHESHKAKGFHVTELKGLPGMTPFFYFVQDPDGYKIEVIQEGRMDF